MSVRNGIVFCLNIIVHKESQTSIMQEACQRNLLESALIDHWLALPHSIWLITDAQWMSILGCAFCSWSICTSCINPVVFVWFNACDIFCVLLFRCNNGVCFWLQEVVAHWIAECRIAIAQTRLLTLHAAHTLDTQGNKAARKQVKLYYNFVIIFFFL